jgi:hypothetical protein
MLQMLQMDVLQALQVQQQPSSFGQLGPAAGYWGN